MMNEFLGLANVINDLFQPEGYRGFPVDIEEGNNSYIVYAEIPGVAKEDISLNFENGVLTIEATVKENKNQRYLIHERNALKMKRELDFGDIDEESLSAKYENGVLEVTIALMPPKPKKTINIQ